MPLGRGCGALTRTLGSAMDRKRCKMLSGQWLFPHTTRLCVRIVAEQAWPTLLMASTRAQSSSLCDAYARTAVIPQLTRRLCWPWCFPDAKLKPEVQPISFDCWSRPLQCNSFGAGPRRMPADWGSVTARRSREQGFPHGVNDLSRLGRQRRRPSPASYSYCSERTRLYYQALHTSGEVYAQAVPSRR